MRKQIEEIKEHGKQLVESNQIIKTDFNIHRDAISLKKKNKKN